MYNQRFIFSNTRPYGQISCITPLKHKTQSGVYHLKLIADATIQVQLTLWTLKTIPYTCTNSLLDILFPSSSLNTFLAMTFEEEIYTTSFCALPQSCYTGPHNHIAHYTTRVRQDAINRFTLTVTPIARVHLPILVPSLPSYCITLA